MADDARQSLPDLGSSAAGFDFFELLRRLERDGMRFGHSGRPDREPARLGQHVRLAFATRDVVDYRPPTEAAPARVTVANLGLLGPEGPLPLHLTRWVLDRLSQRWFAGDQARETSDTTFVDFANTLQHRLIALYFRAWADARPEVHVERRGGRIQSMLGAMSGIGLPGTRKTDDRFDIDAIRLRQAGALAQQVEGPERLTLFLEEALRVPVRIREFVASWITVPRALQTRLGGAHAALGRAATIGPRVFQRQSRIELRVGPLGLDDFTSLLPGGKRLETLKLAVRELVGGTLDVDLRVILKQAEIPPPRIGTIQLGRTAWLPAPRRQGDAEDLCMASLVGWRPAAAEAVA